jgi:glycosyltransferase involved in cell wall biosynthesis
LNNLEKLDVSIIITAYNYARYIEECINSCLLQDETLLRYEVIVVDDGSSDETPLILEKINNKLLRKFRIENSGIEIASNFGFGQAMGRYLVRVDADDKLAPDYLHAIHENLLKEYDFYYSDYHVINGDGEIVGKMDLPEFNANEIRSRGDFLATGTLFSAEILSCIGCYSEEIKNSGLENYELILRLLEAKKLGKHIPRYLFSYRRHTMNISVSKNEYILRNGVKLFEKFGLGPYKTNKYHPYNPTQGLL